MTPSNIEAVVPVPQARTLKIMMIMFFANLILPILSQNVIVSRSGGKVRQRKVQPKAPASDINRSKLIVIMAKPTVKTRINIKLSV